MARIPLTALVLLLLLATGSASAATVRVAQVSHNPGTTSVVEYRAGDGEANRVTIYTGSGGQFRIVDAGAHVEAGAGCVQVGPGEATCRGDRLDARLSDAEDALATENPEPTATGVPATTQIDGGEGDDSLRVIDRPGDRATPSVFANSLAGGPGADRIEGGAAADLAEGGAGEDTILTGAGNDGIQDGEHPDRPADAAGHSPAARDLIDGGAGRDYVRYLAREGGVFARLTAPAVGGYPEEADELRGIEDVTGGSGPDELIGDEHPNRLAGEFGADMLEGGAGADVLHDTSPHRDVFRGGAGNDRLTVTFSRESNSFTQPPVTYQPDDLSCGPGRDSVLWPALDTLVPADCERVRFRLSGLLGIVDPRLPLRSLRDPVASWRSARCASAPRPRRCRVVATLREAGSGLLIGRVSRRLGPRQRLSGTPISLNADGRRLLRKRGSVEVALRIHGLGHEDESGFRLPLSAP